MESRPPSRSRFRLKTNEARKLWKKTAADNLDYFCQDSLTYSAHTHALSLSTYHTPSHSLPISRPHPLSIRDCTSSTHKLFILKYKVNKAGNKLYLKIWVFQGHICTSHFGCFTHKFEMRTLVGIKPRPLASLANHWTIVQGLAIIPCYFLLFVYLFVHSSEFFLCSFHSVIDKLYLSPS